MTLVLNEKRILKRKIKILRRLCTFVCYLFGIIINGSHSICVSRSESEEDLHIERLVVCHKTFVDKCE